MTFAACERALDHLRVDCRALYSCDESRECRRLREGSTLVHSASLAIGSHLQVGFLLENIGTRALVACRYAESTLHFWGIDAKYVKSRLGPAVDHQYCETKMRIAPGETIRWIENVEVPKVEPGSVKIMASVRVVDPNDCDRYGCYDAQVSATASQQHTIVPAAN